MRSLPQKAKYGVSINVCRLVTRTLFFFIVIRPESVAIGELNSLHQRWPM